MEEIIEIDIPDFCWNEYNRHYRNTSIETLDRINVNEADNLKKQFISIGFFLRLTKESKAYKELGYDSIEAYARDRMGYSESRTRRLMQINAMASKDGCSPVLDEQYKTFKSSQLQEMLSMLEDQRQLVKPDMTVRQIKDMKKTFREPEPVQEEAEPKRPEPSDRDIKAFYDWMSFKATDNINANDLKTKYCHAGGAGGGFDFRGSPRGCRINYKQEITWVQLAKRLKDIQEKELAMEQEEYPEPEKEPEEEELLCDTCANASSLTGNPDMCANCGPDGRFYGQRDDANCATSHKTEPVSDELRQSIDNLELSAQTYTALRRAGIDTVEQLKTANLITVRGLGARGVNEIHAALEEIGLC